MFRIRPYSTLVAAVLAAGSALLLPISLMTAPAHATPVEPPAPATVEVRGSTEGFTAPATHPAGVTSFRTTTSDPNGSWIGLVRLHEGVSLDQFLADMERAVSDDPAESVAGGRAVRAEAELFGGAATVPGHPVTFTTVLRPGTYYLVDYRDLEASGGGADLAAERARELTVTRQPHRGRPPHPRATIRLADTPDGPRFQAPARLDAGEPLFLTNAMSQPNEAILLPVKPGTTRADVQAFFTAMDRGEWPQDSPFTSNKPVGTPPISGGQAAWMRLSLEPGTYALVTWVTDIDSAHSGHLLAAQGMHKLITVE